MNTPPDREKTFLRIALIPLAAAFLLPAILRGAPSIEQNYTRTMEAYRSGQWELAGRLSALSLQQIESRAWKDWRYKGTRVPLMTYFTGDLVYMATSEAGEWTMTQVEIHDPVQDKLVRVFDYNPWYIFGSTHSPNYTITFLRWNQFLGYKIAWFEKGNPAEEKSILREEIEVCGCGRHFEKDVFHIFEKGPRGWGLSIFDVANGDFREVHYFENIDINKSIGDQVKLHQGDRNWTFFDGDKIYGLTPGSWEKRLLHTLPFRVTAYDDYRFDTFERLAAVRNDTLYMLRGTGETNYELSVVRLPMPLHVEHWTNMVDFDSSGRWLAQSDSDSLRIFELDGGSARLARSVPSAIGRSNVIDRELVKTFWTGDTLTHYGSTGLVVFKGSSPIYAMEADESFILRVKGSDTLLIYRSPNEFSAFSLSRLEPSWTRKYTLDNLEVFNLLEERYWLFQHIDGVSLLDIKTGEEMFRMKVPGNLARHLNADMNKLLLGGQNFLGVYEIPNPEKWKDDLLAVTACSRWEARDTSEALQYARKALESGAILSGDLPDRLLDILNSLKLGKESVRLMGDMAIRSDDRKWADRLEKAGLDFITPSCLSPFYAIFTMDKGIFSFPALIYPFSVAKGETRTCYWFNQPHMEPERRELPVVGLSFTQDQIVTFEYKLDATGTKLVWSPLWIQESGEMRNLGPLMETDASPTDPENQYYFEYAVETFPYDSSLPDRALMDIILRKGGTGGSGSVKHQIEYLTGLDLTGNSENWYDSTLADPVRIGNSFYAHERYGNKIVTIATGSQADSIGVKVGDIVISFGGYPISNATEVNNIKTYYPDRHPLELTVVRKGDTLNFTVLNGRIGYESLPCLNLVEVDGRTGAHIRKMTLPNCFTIEGQNSSGELVYTFDDTLFFFDPASGNEKRVVIKDLADFKRFHEGENDILLMRKKGVEEIIALDLSKTADDDDRLLWKERFENVYRLYGEARHPITDDRKNYPFLMSDGTLLLYNIATGSVIAREVVPFRNFGLLPQVWNGKLYGVSASKIFAWNIKYYHPPFPWKTMGFGAAAIVPLLFVSLLLNRVRIERLKKKQAVELKRAEIDTEISAARKLQAGLIPTGSHRLGSFHLVGKFIPASEVAGDYFDFKLLDDGRLVVVMGDVSGHGLSAGILVSMAKASLMTFHRSRGTDFTGTLESLNEVIRNGAPSKDMFMTLCYAVLDPKRRVIGCSANGHPFPLVARRDAAVSEIGSKGGYPLGVRETQEFHIVEEKFEPGDTLLIYTDGIPEQMNEAGEPWGYDKFADAFGELAATPDTEDLVNALLERAMKYTGTAKRADDMALVAVRYLKE